MSNIWPFVAQSFILASQSPRRQSLMQTCGFRFTVQVQPTAEDWPAHLQHADIAMHIATQKALAVANTAQQTPQQQPIVSADTIVLLDNTVVLGKPENASHAYEMLNQLAGQTHSVITGMCLLWQNRQHTFYEETLVEFNTLSPEQIHWYIDNCQPYDKAGSYAIQEWIGMVGIKSISGCYYNVMGLPLSSFSLEYRNFLDQCLL